MFSCITPREINSPSPCSFLRKITPALDNENFPDLESLSQISLSPVICSLILRRTILEHSVRYGFPLLLRSALSCTSPPAWPPASLQGNRGYPPDHTGRQGVNAHPDEPRRITLQKHPYETVTDTDDRWWRTGVSVRQLRGRGGKLVSSNPSYGV